jgi:hypothetical protein
MMRRMLICDTPSHMSNCKNYIMTFPSQSFICNAAVFTNTELFSRVGLQRSIHDCDSPEVMIFHPEMSMKMS